MRTTSTSTDIDEFFQEIKVHKDRPYTLPYPKHEFFLHLLENYDVVLHGSSCLGIDVLQPSRARCNSKVFGNLWGVYASTNAIVPIMFAIAQGSIKMEYPVFDNGRRMDPLAYQFDLQVYGPQNFSYGKGMVYVLDKKDFAQGRSDDDRPINEWICVKPVSPLAGIPVGKEDYPFG